MSLQEGLIGHWTMDKKNINNNIIHDSSGKGNSGNVDSSISTQSDTVFGESSFYFDGSGGINLGDVEIQLTSDLTIAFWMKTATNYSSRRNPIDKAYGGEFAFTVEDDNNGELSTFFGSAGSDNDPYATNQWKEIPDGEWVHICWRRNTDVQNVTLHLNGDQYNENKTRSEYEPPSESTDNLFIGNGYKSPFYGGMSDVRIYNRVLSEKEINQLYQMRSQQVRQA